ncbi:MAG TPA: dTDP-4-dehydrorhamnose reductase [Vicinamibacterales bacterium]|nr:dTDP-4-dehydrorhamnose reductase [Vicinamibacterales bacterium]
MRIVVIGASGQLGTDLMRSLGREEAIPLTHRDLDVCDHTAARAALERSKPTVVINTAAYHRVDECEENVERSFRVNAYAVRALAEICRELDAVLVHLSTDYVFGGERRLPYGEEDRPMPLNVYGVSKLAGEHLLQAAWHRHFIVRSSGLYGTAGASGKGGNFVETMLRLAREGKPIRVVDDQVLTPTFTKDLARKIRELISTEAYGLYHVTNEGECSWYEFARTIFELLGLTPDLAPTTTAAFGARARRPSYSVLRHGRLRALGLDDLRPWRDALQEYLREKGYLGDEGARHGL